MPNKGAGVAAADVLDAAEEGMLMFILFTSPKFFPNEIGGTNVLPLLDDEPKVNVGLEGVLPVDDKVVVFGRPKFIDNLRGSPAFSSGVVRGEPKLKPGLNIFVDPETGAGAAAGADD